MSSRSNMSGSACAKPGVTILARVRGACRDAYLTEFPANWYAARRWTKMGSASVLYQGQGPARDILGATDGYGRTCTDPACAAEPRGGRLGELGARADAAARGSLVRGHRGGSPGADGAAAARRRAHGAQPRILSRLSPVSLGPGRRGARGAPHLHLHALAGRCRSEQPLDGPAAGAREDARVVSGLHARAQDRKSTRLNSSHLVISYAVFCLKK